MDKERETPDSQEGPHKDPNRQRDGGTLLRGSISVAVVCVLVGYLLASQLHSVLENNEAAAANINRLETLQGLYNQSIELNEGLKDQLAQLTDELEIYRRQASEGCAEGAALREEVDKLEVMAGLVDVTGPGVTVVLTDSTAANTSGDEADYIIHDSDILSVVNELRSAGAEAISLNGERLLATSEIRCTGPVLTVNGRRYAAPFVVMAIGDEDTLYKALTMRNGVVDILKQWKIGVNVTTSTQLTILKYQGAVEYHYAKPEGHDPDGNGEVG